MLALLKLPTTTVRLTRDDVRADCLLAGLAGRIVRKLVSVARRTAACGARPAWRTVLVIGKPQTVVAWQRRGFRLFWTWENAIVATARTIRHLLREILTRCEVLRIGSIVLPALGTGGARLSPKTSAEIIAEALFEHGRNPTVVRTVIIPVPNELPYVAFVEEFVRRASLNQSETLTSVDGVIGPDSIAQTTPTGVQLGVTPVPRITGTTEPPAGQPWLTH